MRKIIVFFIVFFMMLISYYEKEDIVIEDKIVEEKEIIDESFNIKLSYDDKVIDMDIEDYVIGVVACEMPASFEEEALKAMSVAARTYALYKIKNNTNYVLNSGTSDQCYISVDEMRDKWNNSFEKYYSKIKGIVNETKNEYMTYNDEVIISFYFSISNGYTENCENVFSQKLDYLVSVDSSWDKNYGYKSSEVKFTFDEFFKKLGIKFYDSLSIDVNRSSTNRVNYITVNGVKFKGTKFRKLLSLKSTDIEITHDNKYVYIKTKGYGHGVGMSQYGANYMSLNGYKYDEILKYYYSGIDIVNKI